jgi:hypothetical protein
MNSIVDQRKDSKQHLPPRSGLHPHPEPPPLRPEERENPEPPRRRLPAPPKGHAAPERLAGRRAANQTRNPQWHGHRHRMTRSPSSRS